MSADRKVWANGDWQATAQHSAVVALVRKGWEMRKSRIANGWLQAIRHSDGAVVTGKTPHELLNKVAAKESDERQKARERARR